MIRSAVIALVTTAALIAGVSAASANSHVSFGIGIGIPGFFGGYPYSPYDDDYYSGYPYGGNPYRPYGYSYYPAYDQPLYGGRHVEACYARYLTYDDRTDTFMGYDGRRHRCRIGYGY